MKFINRKKIRNLYVRLLRQSGSPETIAKSAAIGLFIGFFVPVGLQIPITLICAYLLKAKKILSIIFTLHTNVYTIIFIYPVQCWIGGKICGIPLKFSTLLKMFREMANDFSFEQFLELSIDVVISFFAGGLLLGVVSAIIGYFSVYGMIMSYRKRLQNKLSRKLISGR